jgi:hypothetical protein
MGARTDLNNVYVFGSLGVAGVLGLLTGSVTVFVIASAAMIGAAIQTGGIRGGGNARSGNRRHGR